MNVLVVTSQVNFVPRNYQGLLAGLFHQGCFRVAGLGLLRTLDRSLLKTALGLFLRRAPRTAFTLCHNISMLPLQRNKSMFRRKNVPVFVAKSMNEPWIVDWIKDHQIDVVVNARTRCIYKHDVLAAPRLGCINIHHGLLPKYRGTMCDLFALADGRPAGFTIHKMTPKLDDGEILARRVVSTPGEFNYVRYLERSSRLEAETLVQLLNDVAVNDAWPSGEPNRCPKPVYTKTPRESRDIQHLRALGILL